MRHILLVGFVMFVTSVAAHGQDLQGWYCSPRDCWDEHGPSYGGSASVTIDGYCLPIVNNIHSGMQVGTLGCSQTYIFLAEAWGYQDMRGDQDVLNSNASATQYAAGGGAVWWGWWDVYCDDYEEEYIPPPYSPC